MENNYAKYNAKVVLANVEKCIANLEEINKRSWWDYDSALFKHKGYNGRKEYKIRTVCSELSIFDWWKDTLSLSQLKDMQKFLKEAIKLGYDGYVCFKVGATGCANGMWAHKKETKDGYSPDGEAIYKSFTPDYNYWSVCNENNEWECGKFNTIRELENFFRKN